MTRWSSPDAFVIAATAVVIGLGTVWRIPFLAVEHGGGAFLLVYIAALVVMALPLLVAELMLGRGARTDLVSMLARWCRPAGLSRLWAWAGYAALAGAVMVLSYSSVVAGWSMAYMIRAAGGALAALDASGLRAEFLELVGDPEKGLGWHTIFMVAATICASHGVRRGLEPVTRWLMLVVAVMLTVLVVYAAAGEGAARAAALIFRPDFGELGWRGVIEALHQAFFTLSLGTGVLLAFGAYLPRGVSLWRVGTAVLALDTLFALAMGFAVTAIVVAADLEIVNGLQLVFKVVPAALGGGIGGWMATLFFALLVLLSLASAVGLMEPLVVWLRERFDMTRIFAGTVTGLLVWFCGLGTLLSFNLLADFALLHRTLFGWLALLSTQVMLPLFGIVVCVFAGRFLPGSLVAQEWPGPPGWAFGLWRWLLRFPSRLGLIVVVLHAVGVFSFIAWFW